MKTIFAVGTVVVVFLVALNVWSQDAANPFEIRDFQTPVVAAVGAPETNPLVDQYVELASQLALRMTDDELQAGIEDMTRQLDDRNAEDKLNAIRASLQEIIDSHPETQAAAQARRALEDLRQPTGSNDSPFFPGGASEVDDFQPRVLRPTPTRDGR